MILLIVGVGAILSILSGTLWHGYRFFHLVPWIYGAAICLLPEVNQGRAIFHTMQPLMTGLIFYGLAWIRALEAKWRSSRPRK